MYLSLAMDSVSRVTPMSIEASLNDRTARNRPPVIATIHIQQANI